MSRHLEDVPLARDCAVASEEALGRVWLAEDEDQAWEMLDDLPVIEPTYTHTIRCKLVYTGPIQMPAHEWD
jgi:hypothetical protein